MPDWNRLKDRLGLWLAGLAAFALIFAAMFFAAIHPFPAPVLTFFSYWPLLCLLWLPIVVYLLTKSGTTLSMPIVYCGYAGLLFRVAGPNLPSHGVLGFANFLGLGNTGSEMGAVGTIFLTIYWIWQIKRGNGTKKTRRRIKHLPKDNDKELNTGEKYA